MKSYKKFRTNALKAFHNREEIQRAIQIITPKSWVYLLIFSLLFTVGFIWFIFGNIILLAYGEGIIINENQIVNYKPSLSHKENLQVLAFFNMDIGKTILPGMPVTVFLKHISPLEYGGVKAKIKYITEFPIAPSHLYNILKNQKLVDEFMKNGPVFAATIELVSSATTISHYQWTTSKGPKEKITAGSIVTVGVMTKKQPIFSSVIHITESTTKEIANKNE